VVPFARALVTVLGPTALTRIGLPRVSRAKLRSAVIVGSSLPDASQSEIPSSAMNASLKMS
jgi:hypothetical protein